MSALSQQEIERLCIRNVLASSERVFFKDRHSRFVLASAGLLEVVRRQRPFEDVIGKTDAEFASPARAAEALIDEQRVMATGEPIFAKIEHETFEDRPDDWAQTTRLPLRDESGKVVGTWGVTHDITARVEVERALEMSREQLRASEDMHRLMFEHNPQAMFLFDRNTLHYIAVNTAAQQIYGYTREEFLAMSVHDLWEPEDIARNTRALENEPRGPQAEFAPAKPRRHRYKDGTVVDVDIISSDLMVDGRECRLASSLDVTERNRAAAELALARDQAIEASRAKSAFLANISHEIRTPMNGVLGMAELMLDGELNEDQRSLAHQVCRSGGEMVELIDDILDISKIEAGQLAIEVADFPLRETIEHACGVARLQGEGKGLAFDLLIEDDVPLDTRGDRQRLRQVIVNLVSNAVKFTSQGKVSMHASTRSATEGSKLLLIEVTDTGIGISKHALDHVFEPFTQADPSTTRNYGGTGLGLAIARELSELMGGRIGARSEPGAGSTFWIELPLEAATTTERPPALHLDSPPPLLLSWSTTPRVLVAEDSPTNQIVIVRTLAHCGCEADVAKDGREALEMLAARRYDAVLMDCQMPGMDGYEATAELRRRESATDHTPVIALTAHVLNGAREDCLRAGMDDYLAKPIQRQALMAMLQRWIAIPSELATGEHPLAQSA